MKDVIYALMGKKHCAWCIDRPPSIIDRLCRLDQIVSTRHWWERVAIRVERFWTNALPVWELGRRWHFKHHDV